MSTERVDAVVETLRAAGAPLSATGIAERTGLAERAVAGLLGVAAAEGRAARSYLPCDRCGGSGGHYVWAIPEVE